VCNISLGRSYDALTTAKTTEEDNSNKRITIALV
jgi:hypothetical protein